MARRVPGRLAIDANLQPLGALWGGWYDVTSVAPKHIPDYSFPLIMAIRIQVCHFIAVRSPVDATLQDVTCIALH